MGFHRYATPTYSNTLPSGYDYLNNVASGVPAEADGVRSDGGPNTGTYFVGFGEGGLSRAVNRGLKALGENTDALDDLFHRDIAVVRTTALATAGGSGVSSIVLPGPGVFLGIAGTPNTPAGFSELFSILDDQDNEIVDPSTGMKSRVIGIAAGGSVGSGFSLNQVTLTVNPAVPAGTQYRVYYGFRGNLATAPADFITKLKVRNAQRVPLELVDLRTQITRRDSSANVLALLAASLETPDGSRLPRSSKMAFDVDVDGTNGSPWGFTFRRGKGYGAPAGTVMAEIVEQTTADIFGLTRWFAVGRGGLNGLGSNGGTLALFDTNTTAQGTASSIAKYIPLTENGNGAQYTRAGEKPIASSLFRSLNARPALSIGDGVNTFGDFNGATALMDALAANGLTSGTLHIWVKAGTYSITGATGPAIPTGMNVILEGDGADVSILTSNTTDGQTFNIAGGQLTLRGVKVTSSNTTQKGIFTGNGYLRIYQSTVEKLKLDFLNSNPQAVFGPTVWPANYWKTTLLVEDSRLDMNGAGAAVGTRSLIHIRVSDGFEHMGFNIRNTTLRCIDDNAPLKIEAVGSSGGFVRRVHLDNCRLFLGGTTSTAQYLASNPGVLWMEPNLTQDVLGADDIRWRKCDVFANHTLTGTASVLIHVHPGSLRYDVSTENGRAVIGRLTIDGGEWVMPDVNTTVNPWCLYARSLVVRDVDIRQTVAIAGAPPRDAYLYLKNAANSAVATVNSAWGVICFPMNQRSEVSVFEKTRSLDLSNIRIRNVQKLQTPSAGGAVGVPDLFISANNPNGYGGKTRVSDVQIHQVGEASPAAGANPPEARIRIQLFGYGSVVENVVWNGNGVTDTGAGWLNGSNFGFLDLFSAQSGVSIFRRCGATGPGLTTANGPGISVLAGNGDMLLDECFGTGCQQGLAVRTDAGSNNAIITVDGGAYSQNAFHGITFTPSTLGAAHLHVRNVNASYNNYLGLLALIPGAAWGASSIAITDSAFVNNNLGAWSGAATNDQVRIESTGTAGSYVPHGMFLGNTLIPPATTMGSGQIRFILNGITTGNLANFRGLRAWDGTMQNNAAMANNLGYLVWV